MKRAILAFALLTMWATSPAKATLLTYDFTASGTWSSSTITPFGLPSSPTITGSLTVDNTLTGQAAFDDIAVTTGTRAWNQTSLIPDPSAPDAADYDSFGNLDLFTFTLGNLSGAYLVVSSGNTVNVEDGLGHYIYCNGCVNFDGTQPPLGAVGVPEPGSLALLGAALGLFLLIPRVIRC